MTVTAPDEFDAAKIISETLKPFKAEEQLRMLRWVAEKYSLALAAPFVPPTNTHPALAALAAAGTPGIPPALPNQPGGVDIKSFVATKKPKSDTQFAAVVAYYYRFEAKDKKDAITATDLTEACRLANHDRLPNPGQTLLNGVRSGVLDKAARGAFSINNVGENLVAITLPGDGTVTGSPVRRRRGGKTPAKKRAVKSAPAKKTSAKKTAAKTATPKKN